MGLIVWLPLTKDTNNQGLDGSLSFSLNGLTQDVNGKLGKCYKGVAVYHTNADIIGNAWTIAMWVRASGWGTNNDILACKNIAGSDHCQFYFSVINGTSYNLGINTGTSTTSYAYTFNANQWYHLAATYDGSKYAMYINGDSVKTGTCSNAAFTDCTNIGVGCRSTNANGTGQTGGSSNKYFNDFRIYDEALSPREIKEISKGKILHYTLSDSYNLSNIIYNGFGEYGTTGWSGTTASTSDLPSDTSVKAAFTGGQTTEMIPINPNNTYALSCYVKSSGATSGYTYPSILPYDIDGNFISNTQCRDGFSTTWQATLTQPLNKGDTVVHCSDLSNWSTATNNYYNYIAVFGYKDSYGNVYPDFEYTRDSLSFGSYSDKSKLNKTNNTITLNSAYTGEPRPVGTKVCQATAGSSYYYPFGGLALASLQDWTHKTATLNIKNINRLKYAKSIIWLNYSGGKYAGIKMTDTTWGTNIVYDVSGFCNNGEAYTTDGTGQFLTEPDSPRYDIACNIHSIDSTTNASAGTAYILGNCALTNPTVMTIAFWGYIRSEGWNGNGSSMLQGIFCTTMSAGTDYTTSAMNQYDGNIRINDLNGNGSSCSIQSFFILNQWHHYCFVYDGSILRLYRDGTYITSKGFSSAVALGSFNYVMIGFSRAGGVFRRNNNSYSDFRVYATALDDDSIEELYNTPITLSNNGALLTQGEYVEV